MKDIMKVEQFKIREGYDNVVLTSYVAGASDELPYNIKRKAMIVIPGGGYWYCSDREAEPIALAYLAAGFNTFVLEYSVKDDAVFPEPLIEASLAVKFIKDNAEKFNIDPDFVFAVGFSAGGHLAAALGTMWHQKCVYDAIDMPFGYNKVRGVVLAYPVICAGEYAHRGSIDHITGMRNDDYKTAPAEALDAVSIEKQIDENTVPMFIWHTAPDGTVPVQNSLILAKELADKKIPFELHVYPKGGHGLSLATSITSINHTENPVVSEWLGESCRWLENV